MAQVTSETSQQAGLKDQAAGKVQDAAAVAQEKAAELREEGSVRLRDQLDQRSTQAAMQARSLAEALRRSSNDLSNEGNDRTAQLTEQAAARIERLGSYLEQKRGEELVGDIESFARRGPWMLAGVGVLSGVAAARFLKASAEHRYDSYQQARPQSVGASYRQPQPAAGREPAREVDALGNRPLGRDPHAGTA